MIHRMAEGEDEKAPSDDGAEAGSEDSAGKIGNGCALGCGGLIAAFILLFVLTSCLGGGDDEDDPEVQRYAAISACEDWVKDKLKAPATAKFSNSRASGTGPWTVTGDVDAQNSFGAMIRTSWTCSIRLDGDMFRGNAQLLE